MGAQHINQFLSFLGNDRHCSPATQRIALNALIYLYRKYLQIELEALNFEKSRQPRRLPVVLTHSEVNSVLEQLQGKHRLMVEILYGAGLRLNELLSLRIKDLDFALSTITVRSGKGDKDRVTLLPQSLIHPLQAQVKSTALLHQQDLRDGYGEVYMPYALARKYPRAASELGWQFLFPATSIGRDPRSGELRHTYHPEAAWPQRCAHHRNIHTRARARRHGCDQSPRQLTCPTPNSTASAVLGAKVEADKKLGKDLCRSRGVNVLAAAI